MFADRPIILFETESEFIRYVTDRLIHHVLFQPVNERSVRATRYFVIPKLSNLLPRESIFIHDLQIVHDSNDRRIVARTITSISLSERLEYRHGSIAPFE